MKNKILLLIIAAALIVLIFSVKRDDEKEDVNNISLGKCDFDIEIADDNSSRQKGLSERDSLCENCGMLFNFPAKDRLVFWMKGMRFNIDIIWISDNNVVSIEKNVPYDFKGTLPSPGSVNKVLEINAGKSDECKIEKGSMIK